MSRLVEYADRERQAQALAALVAGQLEASLTRRGRATLALPGGTTPERFLKALSGAGIDWPQVTVMPGDERFVPAESPRSNTGMLRRALLRGPAASARLLALPAPAGSPEAAAGECAGAIDAALPLDVLVLGMGADGHIASLFPGADLLQRALDPACPEPLLPIRAPAAGEPRLTLTAPVLLGARHRHILIAGADKLAALQAARAPGPVAEMPVRLLLQAPDAVTIHYAE